MKLSNLLVLPLAMLLFGAAAPTPTPPTEDFEHGMPPLWTTEGLGPAQDRGTVETKQESGGNHFLRISTDGSFYSIGIDAPYNPEQFPILAWRWRIDRLPTGADISEQSTDDAEARLYVVFDGEAPNGRAEQRRIEYVWDTTHPVGSIIPDPYAPNLIKAIVLESGSEHVGQWVRERVNLVADFERAFGGKPGRVHSIACATDSDETHGSTSADFDDLQVNQASKANKN